MVKKSLWSILLGLALISVGCTQNPAFSIQADSNTFKQNGNDLQVKVDILWVIDNSGSMATSQAALAANFQSFMAKFQTTNFDYRMAVTTTDAWRAPVENKPELARFRDGTDKTSHSGVTVITPTTPNLEQTFITNVVQGIDGHPDERGLQSMKEALENADNAAEPFPRDGAILAVIALTDEEDFSHDGNTSLQGGSPNAPGIHPVSLYYDYLYNLTKSSGSSINFIFNTVAIIDDACKDSLNNGSSWTGRMVAERYMELSDLSNGYKGSICDDFSDVMTGISDSILELATQFVLDREPLVETIKVYVNGQLVPQDSENGWSYKESANAIVFHGDAIPGKDSTIQVSFDPAGLK